MRVVQKALTFDDVLLLPAQSSVVPRDVSLQTRLTRRITLNIPLLSAAMDTVTEGRLAIAIAQEGGLGIVHKNMSVREVLALTALHKISGLPVVDSRKVVGIVTNRDLRFETNLDQPVANIM